MFRPAQLLKTALATAAIYAGAVTSAAAAQEGSVTTAPTTSSSPAASPANAPSTAPSRVPSVFRRTGATRPTTSPATTRAVAEVTPAAQAMLAALTQTYAAALPLKIDAHVKGRFDIAGRSQAYAMTVTAQTPDGFRFYHRGAGFGLAVSNGKRGFLFDERRKAYIAIETPAARAQPADVDEAISDVLLEENASLLLALTTDAGELLKLLAARIDVGEPVTIDDKSYAALVLTRREDADVTLYISPTDGLIRRAFIDYRPLLKLRGASAIKAGDATVDFTATRKFEDSAKLYDWQPPDDADEIDLHRELMKRVGRPITGPSTQPSGD